MSEENVNFVRAVHAVWGEGDIVPVAAALDPRNAPPEFAVAFAPDIEVVWAVNAPGQRVASTTRSRKLRRPSRPRARPACCRSSRPG
jgi:hypothetical protein